MASENKTQARENTQPGTQEKPSKPPSKGTASGMRAGVLVTLLWALCVFYIMLYVDRPGYIFPLNLSLNEIGDFLAGVVAPVAFFWLIMGYFLQARELRQQINEFQKQTENTARSLRVLEQKEARHVRSIQAQFYVKNIEVVGGRTRVDLINLGAAVSVTAIEPVKHAAAIGLLADMSLPLYVEKWQGKLVFNLNTSNFDSNAEYRIDYLDSDYHKQSIRFQLPSGTEDMLNILECSYQAVKD